MRSGLKKSLIACPSLRNSGFEATSKAAFFDRFLFIVCFTHSPVSTGTVDFSTITLYFWTLSAEMLLAISVATLSTEERSALPSCLGGVLTVMNTISDFRTPSLIEDVNLILFLFFWALLHHLFAGIRYLLIDIDLGVDKPLFRNTAWAVLIAAPVAALLLTGVIL